MSDSTKKILWTILAVIVGIWVFKYVVVFTLALIFKLVIPALVLLGIVGAIYYVFGRKALGGGRKTLP